MSVAALHAATGTGVAGPRPSSGRAFGQVLRALESKATAAPVTGDDPAGLLAAQASLYREVQRLEIASRVVDQGVSAIKTVLQTKV